MRQRTTPSDVQLAWALDRAGRKVRASRLDAKARRARAPFTCLGCGEPLVPHLGRVRAPHFAHLPGSRCALTAPETALHLDAKERLLALCADAFSGAREVVLLTRCPSCRRTAPRRLGSLGDSAEGEGAMGALRADVLVRSRGEPSLAIEVLVTHAVDAGKEAALAATATPAIEVDAREEWERETGEGVEIVCARTLGFTPCPACQALARADADRAKGGEDAQIAELEAYRARGLLKTVPAPDLGEIERTFTCPECGGSLLTAGPRLFQHPCPAHGLRPVAWRGYDGALVRLAWWR